MTRSAGLAAAAYVAIALAVTWPLAAGFASAVAGTLDRPLAALWAMSTVDAKLTATLRGQIAPLASFWDGNILAPEPNALLYTEPFFAQSVLTLPLWWLTKNPFVIYNAAVIAAFALTAFATFLLTRSLGAGVAASFGAGLVASFTGRRLSLEVGALDVLSIQWLPFAWLAWRTFVARGAWWCLGLTIASAWCLNASSSGYLWTGYPLLIAVAVIELLSRDERRLVDRWLGLAVAIPAVALLTAPFILPVARLQRQHAYLRAGIAADAGADSTTLLTAVEPVSDVLILALGATAIAGAFRRSPAVPAASVWKTVALLVAAAIVGLTRAAATGAANAAYGRDLSLPVIALLLAILASFSVRAILQMGRTGIAIMGVVTVLVLGSSWPGPQRLNAPALSSTLAPPAAYLEPSPVLPAIYQRVRELDGDAVVLELPFGDAAYEARYTFFAALHGRRVVNGFAPAYPPSYLSRQQLLARPLLDPEQSARALSGATHVVLHGNAWPDDTGVKLSRWLESLGATPTAIGDGAILYQIVSPERLASTR